MLEAVTLDDIKAAANKHLVLERSVTGELRQAPRKTASTGAVPNPTTNIQ
jgi:hypothetical protein